MIALALGSVWLLAGFLVRPQYRACGRCGFLYDFDGLRCGHCKRGIGLGRRLLAVLLWPLHFVRRVHTLRALPPLHSVSGRIVPDGKSVKQAMRGAAPEVDDDAAPEQALLGALIIDNQGIRELGPSIPFSRPAHQRIFEAIRQVHQADGRVDLVSLRDHLERRGDLEEVGGVDYLASLVENVPAPAHASHYAAEVRARNAGRTMSEVLRDVFLGLQEAHDGPRVLPGLSTGFAGLDDLCGGLRRGGLYAIAGRPSMGKTSLALGMIESVALRGEKPVLVFSPEHAASQLATLMLCAHAKVSPYRVHDGKLSEEEYARMILSAGAFNEAPIFVDDRTDLDVDTLRATAHRSVRKGLALIVVDAAQLVQERSPWLDLGRELKRLAVELDVPIVVTAPVHRKAESRPGHRAKPIDLRGVGSLDAAADVVLLLYRDDYYDPDSLLKGICEINLGRNRYGPSSLLDLAFLGEFCRFENRARPASGADAPL